MEPGAIVARSVWNYRAWMTAETLAVDEAACWTGGGGLWADERHQLVESRSLSLRPRPPPRSSIIGSLARINIVCR